LRIGLLHQPVFHTSHLKDILPPTVLWAAILTAFVVANAPPKRLIPFVATLLQFVPTGWLVGRLKIGDVTALSQSIVLLLLVPLKALSFLIAVACDQLSGCEIARGGGTLLETHQDGTDGGVGVSAMRGIVDLRRSIRQSQWPI
jgi:hypothetical protein